MPMAGGAIAGPDAAGIETATSLLARTTGTPLPRLLRAAMENPEVTVATVSGGSLALVMAGLFKGRHSVTLHMGMEALVATASFPCGRTLSTTAT